MLFSEAFLSKPVLTSSLISKLESTSVSSRSIGILGNETMIWSIKMSAKTASATELTMLEVTLCLSSRRERKGAVLFLASLEGERNMTVSFERLLAGD